MLLADFLPGIVFAAPFGALADLMSRRHLALGADILRAGAFIALAVLPSFAATLGLALLAGVGSALFRPAVNASVSGLVTDEQRSPAMALFGAGISIGLTVGPALTALVLLFGSATVVLAANGITFLLSAALLSTVPLDSGALPRPDGASTSPDERTSLWSATVDGARSASQIRGVRTLLLLATLSVLAGSLMNVAEPLLATGPLHAGNSGYSLLIAVYGVAIFVGSLALTRAGSSLRSLRGRLLVGLGLQGAGMVGSAAAPNLAWAAVSFAVTGAGNALIIGADIRLVQELVHERLLGRVFGLRDMLTNVAFVLGFLSAGAVLEALGIRAAFALGGAGMVALALAGFLAFRPDRSVEPIVAIPGAAGAS